MSTSYIDHHPHAASDTRGGTFPTKSDIDHWPETGDGIANPSALKSYVDHFPKAGD